MLLFPLAMCVFRAWENNTEAFLEDCGIIDGATFATVGYDQCGSDLVTFVDCSLREVPYNTSYPAGDLPGPQPSAFMPMPDVGSMLWGACPPPPRHSHPATHPHIRGCAVYCLQ